MTMEGRSTMQQTAYETCDACGSHDLRWRRRRWLDFVANWLAASLQMSAACCDEMSGYLDLATFEGCSLAPPRLEPPRWFWRCLECGARGDSARASEPAAGQGMLPAMSE